MNSLKRSMRAAEGATPAAPKAPIHPLHKLSFVKPGERFRGCNIRFWSVTATGDYSEDVRIGHALAAEYIAFEEADMRGPFGGGGHLQRIVGHFPAKHTGIEVGFLILISIAVAAGPNHARRIAANNKPKGAAFGH